MKEPKKAVNLTIRKSLLENIEKDIKAKTRSDKITACAEIGYLKIVHGEVNFFLHPTDNPHRIALYYVPEEDNNFVNVTLDLTQSDISLSQENQAKLKAESPKKVTFSTPREDLIEAMIFLLEMLAVKT